MVVARRAERAAEAWLWRFSPSCHLAQAKGSVPHHADLAQETRTGEGFIHPPTSFIQRTNLRPVGVAALEKSGHIKKLRYVKTTEVFYLMQILLRLIHYHLLIEHWDAYVSKQDKYI